MVVKLLVMDVMEDVREVVIVGVTAGVRKDARPVMGILDVIVFVMEPVIVQSAFNAQAVILVLAVQAVGLAKMVMTIQ